MSDLVVAFVVLVVVGFWNCVEIWRFPRGLPCWCPLNCWAPGFWGLELCGNLEIPPRLNVGLREAKTKQIGGTNGSTGLRERHLRIRYVFLEQNGNTKPAHTRNPAPVFPLPFLVTGKTPPSFFGHGQVSGPLTSSLRNI